MVPLPHAVNPTLYHTYGFVPQQHCHSHANLLFLLLGVRFMNQLMRASHMCHRDNVFGSSRAQDRPLTQSFTLTF